MFRLGVAVLALAISTLSTEIALAQGIGDNYIPDPTITFQPSDPLFWIIFSVLGNAGLAIAMKSGLAGLVGGLGPLVIGVLVTNEITALLVFIFCVEAIGGGLMFLVMRK